MAEENKYNIKIECGTDFVLPFTWKDDNGNIIDLTGATVEAQLREYPEASDCFDFYTQHNGAGGRITLTMSKEITAEIPYSRGYYDVHVTLADGTRKRPLYGEVKITPNVTKPIDGTALYMIGITSYEDLPTEGNVNRLYFCYDDRRIYRWNGTNYIATSIGNGIQRIDFIEHTSEFTDLYRVTYDDGTTWDYTVTAKGVDQVELIGSSGNYMTGTTDTYRMWFNNGTYHDYSVKGGRIVFPYLYVDLGTGNLEVTDEADNLRFGIIEETGELVVISETEILRSQLVYTLGEILSIRNEIQQIIDQLAIVDEAPNDDKYYVRRNKQWFEIDVN